MMSEYREVGSVSVGDIAMEGYGLCVLSARGGAGQSRLQEEHYKFDGLIDSGVRQVQHLQFISCKVSWFFII